MSFQAPNEHLTPNSPQALGTGTDPPVKGLNLIGREGSGLTTTKATVQTYRSKCYALQGQDGALHCLAHAPYLPVAAFANSNLQFCHWGGP
jgi:hypothetical protein